MKHERIQKFLETAVAFDCETHKIQPGLLVPPLVCASVARWNAAQGRATGRLLAGRARYADPTMNADPAWDALEVFVRLLDSDATIVVANGAYDMAVMANEAASRGRDIMPKILAAYEQGRVFDIQLAEALHAIALGILGKDPRTLQPLRDPITNKRGRYSLSICLDIVLGRRDAKVNDRFRQSYALLEDTPIEEWDPEARVYPADDAINTLEVALAQAGLVPRPCDHAWPSGGPGSDATLCTYCHTELARSSDVPCPPRLSRSWNLHDVARQSYAALAMHLGAAWGFMVDPVAVDHLEARVRKNREKDLEKFLGLDFLRLKRVPNHTLTPKEAELVRVVAKGLGGDAARAAAASKLGIAEADLLASVADLTRRGALKPTKNTALVKRRSALSYGCVGACPTCAGTGKVPSAKTGKPVGDRMCDSTGLNLDSAPVPRTNGSKCRTCSGKRAYVEKKSGAMTSCAQCQGQPDIVPGCGTSRDAMSESGDEDLIDFAVFSEEAKLLETYIPFLKKGISEAADEDEEEEEDGEEGDE